MTGTSFILSGHVESIHPQMVGASRQNVSVMLASTSHVMSLEALRVFVMSVSHVSHVRSASQVVISVDLCRVGSVVSCLVVRRAL